MTQQENRLERFLAEREADVDRFEAAMETLSVRVQETQADIEPAFIRLEKGIPRSSST